MESRSYQRPCGGDHRPQARWILRLNGLVAAGFGFGVLLFARPLANLFGADSALPIALGGLGVAFLGADALWVSVKRGLSKLHVVPFVLVAIATVISSLAAIALVEQITPLGDVVLAVVAAVAGAFAVAELRAARDL